MRRFLSIGVKALPFAALLAALTAPTFVWSEDAAPAAEPAADAAAPAADTAAAPEATAAPAEAAPEAAAAPAEAAPVAEAPAPQPMPSGALKLVGDPESGKKIFTEGKGEAPPCMSCHGEQGLGDDNMGTPRLAGLGFVYLRKQLYNFATDTRLDTTMGVMNGIAKALSEQDRADIAAYEASINLPMQASASDLEAVKSAGTVPVGASHLGKGIVLYGIPKQGVPACQSCHQYNGRGAAPIYPPIGGQRYVYLVNQLKKWRDGSRANDPMGQMQAVARNLTDDDIHNVAAYLTGAEPSTIGNTRLPHDLPLDTVKGGAH
ncbi:MAG: c-type cytochrome [Pseudomonadota bacterium]